MAADRTSILIAVAVVSAAAAAVFVTTRQSDPPAAFPTPSATSSKPAPPSASPALPPNHPPIENKLPVGHPPVGSVSVVPSLMLPPGAGAPTIEWVVPKRWVEYPNTSPMRIATYRVPKSYGDVEDPEMYVMRAGGDVEANMTRWISQFDEPSRPAAKRSTRTVGPLKVHVVDVQGTFTTMKGEPEANWGLLGAIVETEGMAHFFKLTGPKKSVADARAEFDALVAGIKPKPAK
ncbi:MAG: hypothetical protein HYV09_39325 [Deltaproteobacteria bacterium]|nr:hypothetical protein [Deltaproteobacteria bacterium]